MLSRPNGELTRAGQHYYQLISRPPPSRQHNRNQPLIREGPNDYIMLRGAKKLLRSLQPNGNFQLTKLGKHFFKDKWVDWVVHVPVIIRGVRRNGRNRGMPLQAHEAPARHGPQRRSVPAERGALGRSWGLLVLKFHRSALYVATKPLSYPCTALFVRGDLSV